MKAYKMRTGLAIALLPGVLLAAGTQATATTGSGATQPALPRVHGRLYAVDAISANDVWAVGCCDRPGSGLITHWDGAKWQPLDLDFGLNPLAGIDAVSDDNIWVVGSYHVLHWDGTQWDSAFNFGLGYVADVTAFNPHDVWAVGTKTVDGEQAAVLHWDGTSWAEQYFPFDATFTDVAAIAPNNVWVVGSAYQGRGYIEHWNGKKWQEVKSADPDFVPSSVSAVSAHDLWIVGQQRIPQTGQIEHWNGRKLTSVSCPCPVISELTDVSATSSTDVWAVGQGYPYPEHAITMHWDGKSWSPFDAPFHGDHESWFTGVSALGPDDAWAVGYHEIGRGPTFEIAAQWDGNAWIRTL